MNEKSKDTVQNIRESLNEERLEKISGGVDFINHDFAVYAGIGRNLEGRLSNNEEIERIDPESINWS